MKVSVALCTYNGARYLAEQLASISAQQRKPDEMIICDDRSTDATAEVVAEFAKTAPFPVIFSVNENSLGVTKNFERAIMACSGDIIFFCDQDDYWLPEKVLTLVREFEADDGVGLVFSDAVVTDSQLNSLGHTVWNTVGFDRKAMRLLNDGEALSRFIRNYTVNGASAAIRAALRSKIYPIPELYLHDGWIAFIAASYSKVVAIDSPLIKYRQHDANVAGGKKKNLIERITASRGTPATEFDLEILRNRELFRALSSLTNSQVERRHLEAIQEKIRHLTARREVFKSSFMGRASIVARELGSRRYFEFSSGIYSAITDLFLHR